MNADIVFLTNGLTDKTKQVLSQLKTNVSHRIITCTINEYLLKPLKGKTVFYPVTKNELLSNEFSKLVDCILKQFNRREGLYFRFYLFSVDFSPEEMIRMIDTEQCEALSKLADVVHLAPSSLNVLVSKIKTFLKHRNEIRRYYAFRRFEALFQLLVGGLSRLIVIASALIIALNYLGFKQLLPAFLLSFYSDFVNNPNYGLINLIAGGIAVAPAVFILQFFIRKGPNTGGGSETTRILENNFDYLRISCIIMVIIGGGWLLHQSYQGFLIMASTIVCGCIINAAGRMFFSGKRLFLINSIRSDQCTPKGKKLPKKVIRRTASIVEKIMKLPIFLPPSHISSVFCSYTHSSTWSNQMVENVLKECKEYGCRCFVDKYGIEPGSSWRHQLRQSMIDADYVLCFCDDKSIRKPWPAAELELALRLRSCSVSPTIIVVTPQDFVDENISDKFPVFESVFLSEGDPFRFVKVARDSGSMITDLTKYGIILQEDYLERSISANSRLILFIPYLCFLIGSYLKNVFTHFLPLLAVSTAGIYMLVKTGQGMNMMETVSLLRQTVFTFQNHLLWYLVSGCGIYMLGSIITDFCYQHFVLRFKKTTAKWEKMITLIFQLSFLFLFSLLFFPVICEVNILQALFVYCILYISGSASSFGLESHVHHGEAQFKNGFDYGETKASLPTAEFRLGQINALLGRKQALSHLYKFFDQQKSFKSSVEIYGKGANDAGLYEGYEQLTKIKNSLLKCGHSHNIAALYDDLGDVAGCMGLYQESLSHYIKKCEFLYASLYSGFKSYSDIYATYYRIAKIYKITRDISAARKYAMLALRCILQNDRLIQDHLDYIWNRTVQGKKSSVLSVTMHSIVDRSVTIEFKLLHNANKKLFEEIKIFHENLYYD